MAGRELLIFFLYPFAKLNVEYAFAWDGYASAWDTARPQIQAGEEFEILHKLGMF